MTTDLPPGLASDVADVTVVIERLRALMPLIVKRWDDFSLAFQAAGEQMQRLFVLMDRIYATSRANTEGDGSHASE